MVRSLLIRGMLVGVLAGLLTFAFARVFGEPQIDLAIGFEDHVHHMAGEAAEPELVSRQVQSTFGLLTGVLVYGCALGGIFSLVFTYAYGRIGKLSPRGTAALLAIAGFVAVILVPQIKYPANPPSIGNPETIGERTALYFAMTVISLIAMVAAYNAGRGLLSRLGGWNAALAGAAVYVLVVAVAMVVLPPVNEVPAEFSAVLLWNFRIASIGMQIVMWATLGLGFGALSVAALAKQRQGAASRQSHRPV
ncbi:MAG: putative cobalt transporter CbtA [Hyphomicrobiales bacterium]|nr:putative cobalt transporter CbtA [Hyphomicrobiales bacterium]